MTSRLALGITTLALAGSLPALARATELAHGPSAPTQQFPSHRFQLAAHRPPDVELSFHYGLSQPIFLHGFNAALDVRFDRFILTYSHGQGLQYDRAPGALTPAEKQAGLQLDLPVTTGFGVGVTLIDELYVLADFKYHHFVARLGAEVQPYDTVTIGAELGYRFFLWKGFHLALVLRYWPNVWSSDPDGVTFATTAGTTLTHRPVQQGIDGSGLFPNLLIGWAFDLGP